MALESRRFARSLPGRRIQQACRAGWMGGRVAAMWLWMIAWAANPPHVAAIIFYSTADSNYNTAAPTGALAGSGWQWHGAWNGFSGTAIGPRHFLAAKHVGGSVGDVFVLNGTSYPATAFSDNPDSDLRLWQISGTFPSWAPLCRSSDEVGRSLVVFGRGLSRGSQVMVDGTLKGWQWGSGGGTMRWGENTVNSIAVGNAGIGELLYATFDAGAGPNEAHLALSDSSGAVFIHDGAGWKLAGVAYSVNGPFNTTNSGSGFNAAIFDAGGLYFWMNNTWQLIPDQVNNIPSGFYATRVSANLAWIDSVLATVTPAAATVPAMSAPHYLLLAASLAALGVSAARRRSRSR